MKGTTSRLSLALGITALCAISTLGSVELAAGQTLPSFIAHKEYGTALTPTFFAQGDLNGDGITDLVIPESNIITFSQQVVVLFGNADGSFQTPVTLNAGTLSKEAAVVADFNGDGKNDIALTEKGGIVVLLGDGKGGFGAPLTSSGASSSVAIIAGDFNGDGKLDLATADTANAVSLLLGKGNGTFQAALTAAVGSNPAGLAAGDFNGDGRLDLAVTDSGSTLGQHGNTVAILLGLGNGKFQAASFVSVAAQPEGIAVADFNRDGKLDVVVTNTATDQVSVLLGKGNGSFQTPTTFTVRSGPKPNGGYAPSYIAVDDFNGDSNPDVVVSDRNTSTATVLLGDGKGHLGRPTNFLVGATPVAVITGDYNRDGRPDFATSNSGSATVSVFLGTGAGGFQVERGFGTATRADQVILADFNEDGLPDIATANPGLDSFNGNTVSVLISRKGGGVGQTQTIQVGTNPLSVVAGDFNNDGHQDLVVANSGTPNFLGTGNLSVILGNGDGTFQAPSTVNIIQPPGNFARSPNFIAAADFNRDGNLDVVACTDDAKGPSLLLGDGNGGFRNPVLISLADACQQVLAADLNRDGKMDLVFRLPQDPFLLPAVFVALGNGDGTFTKPVTVSSQQVFGIALADLNNDGIPDLLLSEPGAVETMLGDGQGNFLSAGFFLAPTASLIHNSLIPTVGDFDGDGFADVAIADEFGQVTYILPGNGDGTLGLLQPFAGGGDQAVAMAAGDLNADGKTDLVLSGFDLRSNKGVVTQLINNTAANRLSFEPAPLN
jgi:hypothetical protein